MAASMSTARLPPLLIRSAFSPRTYATQTGLGNIKPSGGATRKRAVNAFNDDGSVPWGDLTAREKVARTTQQSFNFSLILAGALLSGGVAYLMYTDVFSPDSKISHFNKAIDRIKDDSRCIELLGPRRKIVAYGEPTWNKWRRARPIASAISTDQAGIEHLAMHFHVEGPSAKGTVSLHMARRPQDSLFHYRDLYLDVPGHERVWLENSNDNGKNSANDRYKIFGISWR